MKKQNNIIFKFAVYTIIVVLYTIVVSKVIPKEAIFPRLFPILILPGIILLIIPQTSSLLVYLKLFVFTLSIGGMANYQNSCRIELLVISIITVLIYKFYEAVMDKYTIFFRKYGYLLFLYVLILIHITLFISLFLTIVLSFIHIPILPILVIKRLAAGKNRSDLYALSAFLCICLVIMGFWAMPILELSEYTLISVIGKIKSGFSEGGMFAQLLVVYIIYNFFSPVFALLWWAIVLLAPEYPFIWKSDSFRENLKISLIALVLFLILGAIFYYTILCGAT